VVSQEPTALSNFNAANNRLTMTGITYDAAGNENAYSSYTLTYDAESRNTAVNISGSPYVTFAYDGDGQRVKKQIAGGATTYYVYDALGQMAMDYSSQAPTTTGTSYMFTDMLGSVRTITDQNGNVVENYDYLPFGRMLKSSDNGRSAVGNYPSDPDNNLSSRTPQKFTGQERDAETGLDNFGARYVSAAQGRFMSPDPLGNFVADASSPQSWNLYSYVNNNPLNYIDPTGQKCVTTQDGTVGDDGVGEPCNDPGIWLGAGNVVTVDGNDGSNGNDGNDGSDGSDGYVINDFQYNGLLNLMRQNMMNIKPHQNSSPTIVSNPNEATISAIQGVGTKQSLCMQEAVTALGLSFVPFGNEMYDVKFNGEGESGLLRNPADAGGALIGAGVSEAEKGAEKGGSALSKLAGISIQKASSILRVAGKVLVVGEAALAYKTMRERYEKCME
jgi:RHS repeat-associated protein